MPDIKFAFNNVTKNWEPTAYPVKEKYDMKVPEEISKDFNQLTSFIEDKYAKEFLKVCAFYNKLFISLKAYEYSRASYNTVPFTLQAQERTDTGTGLASNYLKAAIDLVVSRIGNIKFDYKLKAEQPTVQYTIYKDEIERTFRSLIRKNNLNRIGLESFHDASILGFAHAFIDPWAGTIRKVSDWELGFYESEFVDGRLVHCLVRDFAFPVAQLDPYIEGFKPEKIAEIRKNKPLVDLRLYFDCKLHKKYVAIEGDMGPATDYPFDEVLLASMSWDLGIRKTTIASLFDSLYPLQRQMDKLLAKKTQMLNQYKGPVPVFSGTDYDVVLKQMNNSAGEMLFLDTNRKVVDLLTMLEPTPLDPNLNSEMESIKSQMFELAGVQQISMDMENYRSAAAVIALDQMRDAGFQSQLTNLAQYITDIVNIFVRYQAKAGERVGNLEWADIEGLLNDAYLDIVPMHNNDPSNGLMDEDEQPDYMLRHIEQLIIGVCKGVATYDDVDFSYDRALLKQTTAVRYVELRAVGSDGDLFLDNLQAFLIELFIDDIADGTVMLGNTANILPAPPEAGGLS